MIPGQEQSSIGGTIWDLAGFATWQNPLWTRRIGTVGFDSRGKGLWAGVKRGVNAALAPRGNAFWAGAEAAGNLPVWAEKASMVDPRVLQRARAFRRVYPHTAADLRAGGSWFARATATGEPGIANIGRTIMHKRMGGFSDATSKLFGGTSSLAMRHAAGMWIAGRVLTAANTAGLVAALGTAAFAGFNAVADIGLQARQNFQSTVWGSGVATMRQQAIQDMQTRDFGPRSLIGQEARFLHT